MRQWVQTCPGCGACAPDLAALPTDGREIVPGDAYATMPSPFERWAALVAGTAAEAEALLQTAWLAEDEGKDGTDLRRRALAVWPQPDNAEGLLRLADLQRRAGLLDAAGATLDRLPIALDDGVQQVAAFQRARIAAGDTGRHLLSSALRPPARTPHVSHGKPARAGFWTRLFGGVGR